MSITHTTPDFIRLECFNLWPGAVIHEGGILALHELRVVTRVERNHDTEEVVLWHRELNEVEGMAPTTVVVIKGFAESYRVFGNVVNPDETSDNNGGWV